jgi:hypothetical protein
MAAAMIADGPDFADTAVSTAARTEQLEMVLELDEHLERDHSPFADVSKLSPGRLVLRIVNRNPGVKFSTFADILDHAEPDECRRFEELLVDRDTQLPPNH